MHTSYLIGLGFFTASLLFFKHWKKKESSQQGLQFICHPTAIFVLKINSNKKA